MEMNDMMAACIHGNPNDAGTRQVMRDQIAPRLRRHLHDYEHSRQMIRMTDPGRVAVDEHEEQAAKTWGELGLVADEMAINQCLQIANRRFQLGSP
jgi:hypothetical protein